MKTRNDRHISEEQRGKKGNEEQDFCAERGMKE